MAAMSAREMEGLAGTEWVSDWVLVDQDRIDRFADATGDHQFIHVDPVRARDETPFGGTVAHGFLTLSLLPLLSSLAPDAPRLHGARMGVNYGSDKVRFVSPVPAGSRVRGRFRLRSFHQKAPGRFEQLTDVTVEIEGRDKPALVAEWIGQVVV